MVRKEPAAVSGSKKREDVVNEFAARLHRQVDRMIGEMMAQSLGDGGTDIDEREAMARRYGRGG